MRRISERIYTWSVFSKEKEMFFNGHWVSNGTSILLVDPPALDEADAQEVEDLGRPGKIVLTNKDHVRDAPALSRRFGAPIHIHEADRPLVSCEIAGTFTDGDLIDGFLRVVHIADGKSPGESALYFGSEKAVILGDALIGHPQGRLSMMPDEKYADPARAKQGLQRLKELDIKWILVGDGASIFDDAPPALRSALR